MSRIRNSKMVHFLFRQFVVHPLCRMNPTLATKVLFRAVMNQKLDLEHPKTFNEKIQYLKLNDYYNNKTITMAVDKYAVREYLKDYQNGKYASLLNTLVGKGRYRTVSEIKPEELPDSFVLKCNHDSGSVIVCKNKKSFDWEKEKKKLAKSLKKDFWLDYGETQYKYVEKCIICETYLEDDAGGLVDYKFYCFNGEPKLLYCTNPYDGSELLEMNFFDMDFQLLDIHRKNTQDMKVIPQKPAQFDEMVRIAADLAAPFPFVRIDLFVCKEKIYIGEFTFLPSGGLQKFKEPNVDQMLGDWLNIGTT